MNFKHVVKCALVVLCISLSIPAISGSAKPISGAFNEPINKSATVSSEIDPLKRLEEIRRLSKENLTSAEKKSLRKEVKKIRKEVRTSRNGIYLSVGSAIIIALLLILLL